MLRGMNVNHCFLTVSLGSSGTSGRLSSFGVRPFLCSGCLIDSVAGFGWAPPVALGVGGVGNGAAAGRSELDGLLPESPWLAGATGGGGASALEVS